MMSHTGDSCIDAQHTAYSANWCAAHQIRQTTHQHNTAYNAHKLINTASAHRDCTVHTLLIAQLASNIAHTTLLYGY